LGNGQLDNIPIENSNNLVKSGGVFDLLKNGSDENYISGKYLDSAGTAYNRAGWNYGIEYIPVNAGDTITWNFGVELSSAGLILYNINKERIGYRGANTSTGSRTITLTEEGVVYLRPSFADGVTDVLIKDDIVLFKKTDYLGGLNDKLDKNKQDLTTNEIIQV